MGGWVSGRIAIKHPVAHILAIKQTSAGNIGIDQDKNDDCYSCDTTRHAFLSKYVQELWGLAREKLYKDTWLNKRQCTIAQTLLYRWYEPVSNDKLAYVHQVYVDRIDLVYRYIEKDRLHRFVTLPYLYFDPNNPDGFAGTKSWYEAEKTYKWDLKLQRILRQQIRKFKRNEAKDTAVARPRLEVYRECEQRLGKLKVPKLLNKFYAAVKQHNKQE